MSGRADDGAPLTPAQVELLITIWREAAGPEPGWPTWDRVRRILYRQHPDWDSAEDIYDAIPYIAAEQPRGPAHRAVWHSDATSTPSRMSRVGLTLLGLIQLSDRGLVPDVYALEFLDILVSLAHDEARLDTQGDVQEVDVPLSSSTQRLTRPTRERILLIPDDMTAQVLLKEFGNPLTMFQIGDEWKIRLSASELRPYRQIATIDDYRSYIAAHAIPRGDTMAGSFLLSSTLGHEDVDVIHNRGLDSETHDKLPARIHDEHGVFEVDAPVYEGDVVVAADPRGGRRELIVDRVVFHNQGSVRVRHLEARWRTSPGAEAPGANPAFHFHGGNNQVVYDSHGTVHQSMSVTGADPRWADLIDAVTEAKKLLRDVRGLHAGDRDDALTAAEVILVETASTQPDPDVVRRPLTVLRGVVASLASGSATATMTAAAAVDLVSRLILHQS